MKASCAIEITSDRASLLPMILSRVGRRSFDRGGAIGAGEEGERGVDVRLLVPGKHIDNWLAWFSAQSHYQELLDAGGGAMSPLHGAIPPMGTATGESLRALLVSAGFLLSFALAEGWRRRFGPPRLRSAAVNSRAVCDSSGGLPSFQRGQPLGDGGAFLHHSACSCCVRHLITVCVAVWLDGRLSQATDSSGHVPGKAHS